MYDPNDSKMHPRPNPSGLDYASFGTDLLGTLLGAYGTYQAAEQADKQYELALRAWEEERDRMRKQDDRDEQQRQIGNQIGFGNYARDLEKDVYGTYTPYSRSIGR